MFGDMGEILPRRPGDFSTPPPPTSGCPSRRETRELEELEETIMHPMFVTLFIETDADELLAEEQDRKRRAHAARRGRSARVMRLAAANRPVTRTGAGS